MNAIIINKINILQDKIRAKVDSNGMTSADFFIILTLEILRAEITANNLTDLTIDASREITANVSHYYYFRDYPDLYEELQNTFIEIQKLDKRFFSADMRRVVKSDPNSWRKYIAKATQKLLEDLPSQYFYNKNTNTEG